MIGAVISSPFCRVLAVAGLLIGVAATERATAGDRGGRSQSSGDQGDRRSQQQDAPVAAPQPIAAPQAAPLAPTQSSGQSQDGASASRATASRLSGEDDGSRTTSGDGRGGLQQDATQPASGQPGTGQPGTGQARQGDGQDQQGRRTTSAPGTPVADQPPRTVEEWLKQLIAPGSATPAAEPSHGHGEDQREVRPAGVPVAPDAPAVPAGPATKPKIAAPAGRVYNPVGEVIAPEILAPGLSRGGLARAQALGFTANGKVALSQAGGGVTRLLAPPGISADAARALLHEALPGQSLGVNQTYRIYKTAAEPSSAAAPTPMATPCGTDHCFGSNLIGWRPNLQACARKVKIGVIDTAFDGSHPTFVRRQIEVRARADARLHQDQPAAPNWHGTGVLAILAGEPHSGTPGLIPDGRYLAADVFFADAGGLPVSDTASLIEALDWLEQRHADIINMSLTGPHDELLQAAIERMSKKGILFVAAVGNEGPTAPPTYPSAYAQVLAVTAINRDLSSYRYANRGDHVDLAAPGVGIWTAMPGGQGTYHSGTSFAVPYATAVLASIYGSLAVKSKAEALAHMNFVDLGVPGKDPIYGNGLVIAPYACAPEHEQAPPSAHPTSPGPVGAEPVVASTAGGP